MKPSNSPPPPQTLQDGIDDTCDHPFTPNDEKLFRKEHDGLLPQSKIDEIVEIFKEQARIDKEERLGGSVDLVELVSDINNRVRVNHIEKRLYEFDLGQALHQTFGPGDLGGESEYLRNQYSQGKFERPSKAEIELINQYHRISNPAPFANKMAGIRLTPREADPDLAGMNEPSLDASQGLLEL